MKTLLFIILVCSAPVLLFIFLFSFVGQTLIWILQGLAVICEDTLIFFEEILIEFKKL